MKETNITSISEKTLKQYAQRTHKRKFYPPEFQQLDEAGRIKWASENNIIYKN